MLGKGYLLPEIRYILCQLYPLIGTEKSDSRRWLAEVLYPAVVQKPQLLLLVPSRLLCIDPSGQPEALRVVIEERKLIYNVIVHIQ